MHSGFTLRRHGLARGMRKLFAGATCVSMLALNACSAIPDSGPTEQGVLKAEKDPAHNPLQFEILSVTPQIASMLASEVPPSSRASIVQIIRSRIMIGLALAIC